MSPGRGARAVRPPLRIAYLIIGGVLLMFAVVLWLAQGRQVMLQMIEDNFLRLQQVARTGHAAAEVAARLAALTAAIREYVAAGRVDPPPVVDVAARALVGAIDSARRDLPAEREAIDALAREAEQYLSSVDAVRTARRQRSERLARLTAAAAALRDAATASGQQGRYMALREAEAAFLAVRDLDAAARVAQAGQALSRKLAGRRASDALADYELAFARVGEIFGVLDRATVRVMDEHDARLRALAGGLARRAQAGEGAATTEFHAILTQAATRNLQAILLALLVTVGGALLLLRFVVRPLDRIAGTMAAIAAGDHARPIPYLGRRDEVGQMAEALGTFRDALAELKAAQARAEDASRHKSDFIANMSHELRTPLNAIIGLSDMLLEDIEHPDIAELKESLPRIGAAARHLLGLINEILDLSRIEAGRMDVHLARVAPAAVAQESLATVAPMARQKGLSVTTRCESGLPDIVTDAQRVRQILINLLGNAVKFTDEGSVIIEAVRTPEGVRFSVIDTGPGIAAEDTGRLFQEFTQLDASSTRKFGGSGLGLALSRRMARLIGGDVTLASEVGHGSTFMLDLPLAAPNLGGQRENAVAERVSEANMPAAS
jgi:signal transduction histidine kinase